MQFSGKITNSVLVYLSRRGWERDRLFEVTDLPVEFLRDPTSWMPAEAVENFLRTLENEFGSQANNFVVEAGHLSSELRGWGVLDSVLRMMQKPQDIFSQPHRFMSYFVSPAPPIVNVRSSDESVSFDLPIAHNEYPATVAYLSAALEGLPKFWGQERAQVTWRNASVKIAWSEAQSPLLSEASTNPRPELVESLVHGVEMAQAQMEARDLEIARLEQEVRELKGQLEKGRPAVAITDELVEGAERSALLSHLGDIRENVLRLSDYLTRAQQALTLARTAHRQDPQVLAVLKRIDWETIRSQYPWIHLQIMEGLSSAERLLSLTKTAGLSRSSGRVKIQEILDSVVARLGANGSKLLSVRQKSFIEESLSLDVDRLHVALWQMLSAAAREMGHRGEIEMMARRDDGFVEVVLAEKSSSGSREQQELPLLQGSQGLLDSDLLAAEEIINEHQGAFRVVGETPGHRQFICRWPLADN